MLLSIDDIVNLTGFQRPKKQIEALKSMGIRHWVRPNGRPVVDDSALKEHNDSSTQPNFEVLM